jgi:hypothetical protein
VPTAAPPLAPALQRTFLLALAYVGALLLGLAVGYAVGVVTM